MKFNDKRIKGTLRAEFWNYSAPGYYFLTICTKDMESFFGEVKDGRMILSPEGWIVKEEILKLPSYHQRIELGEWVVMPNHVHFILELERYGYINNVSTIDDGNRRPSGEENNWWDIPDYIPTTEEIRLYHKYRRRMLIPKVIGKFKTLTSKNINKLNNSPGNQNWKTDYYDHIIRDGASFMNIKRYIMNNPEKWGEDKFNYEKM